MLKFEDIYIGQKAELKHTITAEDVEKFVELSGDDNRLHVDVEYASQTSFKKPVVHGILGASFISTVIGTKLPGDGALWFSQSLDFILPVRIGDKILVTAEVINKFEREKIIELKTDIFNQHNQCVTSGVAKVKLVNNVNSKIEQETLVRKKVALVLGASGGIGSAVALRLAEDGYDIAVHFHSNKIAANELKCNISSTGRKCHIYNADITSPEQMNEMVTNIVRHFNTITLCVNCTTVKVANCKFLSLEWETIQSHIDSNIKGSYLAVKYILPLMQKQRYGKFINLTSQYIEGTPPSELLAYVTAKSALAGFSKSLAVEFAPFGITFNMISPGMTDTELIADIPEKTRLITTANTPLRRLARPHDIAGAVSFLASDNSNFLTGETIRINGGKVML